jgi:hypothetical protein
MGIKIGDYVETPRFLKVRIIEMFDTTAAAFAEGFREPTHYRGPEYEIYGKHIGPNRMQFAAVWKEGA